MDIAGSVAGAVFWRRLSYNKLRPARLRINAAVPNDHGGHSVESATVLLSLPRHGVEMFTTSPM